MQSLCYTPTDAEISAIKALSYDQRGELRHLVNCTDPQNVFDSVGGKGKSKENQIVCPKCNSGTGNNGHYTGVKPTLTSNGEWLYNCLACRDFHGKLFSIIARKNNLSTSGKDFFVVLAIAVKILGINLPTPDYKSARPAKQVPAPTNAPKTSVENAELEKKYLEFTQSDIKKARGNLRDFIKLCKNGLFRCLTLETLEYFGCGYDESWNSPKNRAEKFFGIREKLPPSSRRVIIPTVGDNHYNAVAVPEDRAKMDKKYWKIHAREKVTFGLQTLNDSTKIIFATEGEIDAMSMFQTMKSHCPNAINKFGFIASLGISETKWYSDLDTKFASRAEKPIVIWIGDGDKKKQDSQHRDELLKRGYPAFVHYFSDENKLDANEILCKEGGDALFSKLQDFQKNAKENLSEIRERLKKESAVKEKFADWTQRNGEIDAETLKKINAAAEYLKSLTGDKINSTVATESKTIQAVAMCKFYDFYQQVADDFLARVLSAKDGAKEKLKSANSENPVEDSVRLTARIDNKAIFDAVKKEITALEKKHLKYQQQQESKRRYEEYQRRNQEMQDKNQVYLNRLQELQKQPPTPARNAEMQEIIREMCEWKLNKFGEKVSVKPTMKNYDLIFTYDPYIKNLFGFEEFSQADVFLNKPQWRQYSKFEQWKDSDDANLRVYLRRTYTDISGDQLYYDVFKAYSQQNSFNVAKNYFENLPAWDKVERAETLFSDFLKVADTPYARAVTLKWLLAAVARIYYPGCNFQAALVLQGNQNVGKSYIFERLGGERYGALIDNLDDTHAVDAIKNKWIVEMKEFSAARKAEVNAIKSFIERAADNHRAAYEKRVQTFKRHCVFAITVNDGQFLRDITGNRRFWILESKLKKFDYQEGLTDEYIQQIWAEVLFKFKELTKEGFNDKILELPKEFKIQAEEIAEKFVVDDGLNQEIPAFLDIPILPPVLWKLLTKEEKRKFFAKNFIELDYGDWTVRKGRLNTNSEKIEFENAISDENKNVRYIEKKFGNDSILSIAVYGSYKRQETCAVEIYNEFYTGNDKRKQTSTSRINDVLKKLDDWQLVGKQKSNFNGYGNQKNIYCRIKNEEEEVTADDSETLAQDSNYFVEGVDVPF